MKNTHARRIRVALLVGCVSLTAGVSAAQAEGPVAKEHAKKAQNAFDVQSWATAIQEYQAAYQAEPKPEYLWGLAQSQRLSGDCAAAIKSYKAFKRNDAVTANQATVAGLQITKCENDLEKTKQAEVAKAPQATAPPPASGAPPSLAAAPAPAKTAASGAPERAAAEPPAGPKPFYTDILGDVLLASGVVAVGVGGFLLLTGNGDMRDTVKAADYRTYDTGVDDATTKQTGGAIVLAGGGVLVGLAVVRYLTMGPKSTEPRMGLTVGPGSVGYVGRFSVVR
jgi:hypothetical protein